MKDFLYLERVEYMLHKLLNNEPINTTEISKYFGVKDSQIRKDLRERIKPLFPKTIKKEGNNWVADRDLLENQFFSSEELLMISLLYTITKDLNVHFYEKTVSLFKSLHEKASDAIYKQASIEDILETHNKEFHLIENAIKNSYQISFKYYKYEKNINPLKIVNLEKYWYLMGYDIKERDLRTFYFKGINELIITSKNFDKKEYNFLDNLHYAINAFYKANNTIDIELEMTWKAYSVFDRKKINPTQKLSWDKNLNCGKMYITVSDIMEIAPLIQQWIPNIFVLHPPELISLIENNIKEYQLK